MPSHPPRRLAVLAGALALLFAAPATAQDPPRIPTRDYAATYAMSGLDGGPPQTMRIAYSAALKRQRIDGGEAGHAMSMIMEMEGARMWMLSHEARMAMVFPRGMGPAQSPRGLFDSETTLTRIGTDRVIGHACTLYRVSRQGRTEGTACLTGDGILLRSEFEAEGRRGRIEATELRLDRQPAERFEVPASYQVMEAPAGPRGEPPRRR